MSPDSGADAGPLRPEERALVRRSGFGPGETAERARLRERASKLFDFRPEPEPDSEPVRQPVVLIATTTAWLTSARQALAFHEAGFVVEALCPSRHPLRKLGFVRARRTFDAFAPLRSLRRAIEAAQPDLVAPGDDRAVRRLHALHAWARKKGDERLCALVATSLGAPERFVEATSRARFMELAAEEGVRRPDTVEVAGEEDLERQLARIGFPAVLKSDGSWGGEGVAMVRNGREALRAYRRLSGRPGAGEILKRLLLDGDLHFALDALFGPRPAISLQRFVSGRPANAAAACWRGAVLSELLVDAVKTTGPRGHASVVRILDHPEMTEAVRRIAGRMGLSGLCGFDFLLDECGAAWLLEFNPRLTPTCHLRSRDGTDPAAALCQSLGGRARPPKAPRTEGEMIALFPQELSRDPASALLLFARHDVPTRNAALVKIGLRAASRARWRRVYRRVARALSMSRAAP